MWQIFFDISLRSFQFGGVNDVENSPPVFLMIFSESTSIGRENCSENVYSYHPRFPIHRAKLMLLKIFCFQWKQTCIFIAREIQEVACAERYMYDENYCCRQYRANSFCCSLISILRFLHRKLLKGRHVYEIGCYLRWNPALVLLRRQQIITVAVDEQKALNFPTLWN